MIMGNEDMAVQPSQLVIRASRQGGMPLRTLGILGVQSYNDGISII